MRVSRIMMLSAMLLAACSHKKPPEPQGPTGPPLATASDSVTATATVQAIDPVDRKVTLREADGTLHTYKCGKGVAKFDQFKTGDQVSATVTNEIALFLPTPGEKLSAGEASSVTQAPTGQRPGI